MSTWLVFFFVQNDYKTTKLCWHVGNRIGNRRYRRGEQRRNISGMMWFRSRRLSSQRLNDSTTSVACHLLVAGCLSSQSQRRFDNSSGWDPTRSPSLLHIYSRRAIMILDDNKRERKLMESIERKTLSMLLFYQSNEIFLEQIKVLLTIIFCKIETKINRWTWTGNRGGWNSMSVKLVCHAQLHIHYN